MRRAPRNEKSAERYDTTVTVAPDAVCSNLAGPTHHGSQINYHIIPCTRAECPPARAPLLRGAPMKRKNTAKASVTQAADSVIDLAESLLGNPTSTANRLAAAVRRLAVTAVSAMTSRAAPAMLWHAGEHDWRRSSEIDNTMRQPSSVSPHRLGTCGREARQRDAATRRQHQEQLSEQEQQPFVRRGCTGVRQRRHASDAATPPRAARARPTLRGLNSSAPPTPYSVSSPGPRTRPLPEPALPCTGAAVTREASNRARGTWARYRPAGCTAGRCSAVGLVLAAGRECVLSAPRWSAAMFKTLKRVLSMSLRVLSVCRVFMAHANSKMNGRGLFEMRVRKV